MSVSLLLAFASVALAAAHGFHGPVPAATPGETPVSSASSDRLSFDTTVRPVLAKKCSPCHAPGGKMYARLPFDDAPTVASHPEGIRKRLKGDDLKVYEDWLAKSK
jgi:hypothetical protein